MKVATLNAVVKLASKISNQSSLTALYRSVELSKDTMRCCSEFGNMEISGLEDTGLTTPILIDCASLSTVTGSLPGDKELQLIPGEGKVVFKCGSSETGLNFVFSEHAIPTLEHAAFPWQPGPDLANALVLASSACQAAAVSVGLYGIVLEAENDKLRLLSTNATALASVTIDKGTFPVEKITIRPPVPGVLATFLSTCPNCTLDVTPSGIFIQGDWLKAHLPVSVALEHDLKSIASEYTLSAQTAPINIGAVKQFVGRARGLADKNAYFTVALSVENGHLALKHASIASTTEEHFLCEGLDLALNYSAVNIPAEMLMAGLPYVNRAIFDYLGQTPPKLILEGTDPSFRYVVSGGDN